MDELAFAAWVDGVEEQLAVFPVEPFVCAYAEPTAEEAELATAELRRRGHNVIILSVKSTKRDGTPLEDGLVYGLFHPPGRTDGPT